MRKIITLIFIFNLHHSFAQKDNSSLQLSFGTSGHGTGDLQGFALDLGYDHVISRRLDFSNGITTTMHSGYDYPYNGLPERHMLHYTTAGIQLNSMVNFSFISLPRHKFRIGGGTVLRYQSTSLPDVYSMNFNSDPDDPTYRFNFYNQPNIFTIGYSFDISYIARVTNKFQLGIKAQFQNDTNGDAITQLSLIVGRYLSCSK